MQNPKEAEAKLQPASWPRKCWYRTALAKINKNASFLFLESKSIRPKPPIMMWFGALILQTLIKSSDFEFERLHENCLDHSILKVETLQKIT